MQAAKASDVVDYWPKDIRHGEGYNRVQYTASKDETVDRLIQIVESWKHTANKHSLDLPVVNSLRCITCVSHENCCSITAVTSESPKKEMTFHGQVKEAEVEVNVEDSIHGAEYSEIDITIKFQGTLQDTQKPYSFSITVNKYPEKTATIYLDGKECT